MTTQDMMCSIWMNYVDDNSTNGILTTANDTDTADISELDAYEEEDSDGDCDPYVDFNGNEISRLPKIVTPDIKDNDECILAYLHQAYPSFITTPQDGAVIHAGIIPEYSSLPTTTLQARDVKGNAYRSHFRRTHWDPYASFFQKAQWTTDNDSSMTYVELAIAVSIYSKGITSEGYDLETCTKRARFALAKYFSSGITIDNSNIAYKVFFQPHGQISTLSSFGQTKLPGFHRKLILNDMHPNFMNIFYAAIWRACMSNSGNSFGRGVYIHSSSLNIWTPCPLHEAYRVIANRKTNVASTTTTVDNNSVPPIASNACIDDVEDDHECTICAIDYLDSICMRESTIKWFRLLSFGRQSNDCIHELNPFIDKPSSSSEAAHVSATTLTNITSTDANVGDLLFSETNVERISRLARDIINRQRMPRNGPCHICHSSTTAAKYWHASPISNPWPGIAADTSLCQRCFQIYYRAVRRGSTPIFADHARPPD